jgi:predicted protein tyrosine phosphatase
MNYHLERIPVVRDITTAEMLSGMFPSIVTAGPSATEVNWGHANHLVESFPDTTATLSGPQLKQVERMLKFGQENEGRILVHCHAGVSRSTATAIGIMMARGYSPESAVDAIHGTHPQGHEFWPNELIIEHVETIFALPKDTIRRLLKSKRTYLQYAR